MKQIYVRIHHVKSGNSWITEIVSGQDIIDLETNCHDIIAGRVASAIFNLRNGIELYLGRKVLDGCTFASHIIKE